MEQPVQDKQQIKNLANLARIDVSDDIVTDTMESINDILSLMNQLHSVDTKGIKPMAHPTDVCQRLRADKITEIDQREQLQAVAPAVENGLFLVPKVID
jgi:aspartyl-tRNA(Asn)/glutamyl-tRNA(Gln) amidotransferase subunit C